MNILKCSILSVFFSSKCSLFHNANLFGSCIIHILYTGCAKIKKNNSDAKGLIIKELRWTCTDISKNCAAILAFQFVARDAA